MSRTAQINRAANKEAVRRARAARDKRCARSTIRGDMRSDMRAGQIGDSIVIGQPWPGLADSDQGSVVLSR